MPFEIGSRFVEPLRSSAGAAFSRSAEGDVIAEIDGLRVVVNAEEVLFILNEIFVEGQYDIEFRYPAVVWDIGMNRGLASLYFARRENVVAVVGYEPFGPTYELACDNFALNPDLAKKIQAFNHGVGSGNRTLRAAYSAEWLFIVPGGSIVELRLRCRSATIAQARGAEIGLTTSTPRLGLRATPLFDRRKYVDALNSRSLESRPVRMHRR